MKGTTERTTVYTNLQKTETYMKQMKKEQN